MNLLTNPWFVGILGGIISGIIVFFITNFIVNKLNKKDYYKSVDDINLKISKMLIMSISENKIPSPSVIDSILSSLAKKYKVQKKDVNSVEETYNDLITELFETNFIPLDKKQSLAETLIEIKSSLAEEIDNQNTVLDTVINNEEIEDFNSKYYFSRLKKKLLSFILSLGIVLPIYFSLMYILLKDNPIFNTLFEPKSFSMILSIMTITFSLVTLLLTILTKKKSTPKINQNKKSN